MKPKQGARVKKRRADPGLRRLTGAAVARLLTHAAFTLSRGKGYRMWEILDGLSRFFPEDRAGELQKRVEMKLCHPDAHLPPSPRQREWIYDLVVQLKHEMSKIAR